MNCTKFTQQESGRAKIQTKTNHFFHFTMNWGISFITCFQNAEGSAGRMEVEDELRKVGAIEDSFPNVLPLDWMANHTKGLMEPLSK